jgi:hypothetical protein
MKFEVVEVGVIGARKVKPPRLGARLCGYASNVCLALVDIEQ